MLEQRRDLAIQLPPHREDLMAPEAAELIARPVEGEPGGSFRIGPERHVQRRVEQDRRLITVHPLGDDVVAHGMRTVAAMVL